MKILLVASLAESLINFRGPLIAALQEKGLKVHVTAPNLPESAPTRITLEAWGVVVHHVSISRAGINPWSDLGTLWALWRLMLRVKPDVVLGYTIKPVIYGSLAAWLAGVPRRFALITGLGYAFTGKATGLRAWIKGAAQTLYKQSLARVDKVFFQNPDDEALFRDLRLLPASTHSVVVNGSGVDVSKYAVCALPQGDIRFLLIARLLGDKGVLEYAMAAARIKTNYPFVQFSLVGWIDHTPDAIAQHELDSWIKSGALEYFGRMEDVRPAIAACSVYVLPSYREGTPRTVLESMAMGRPIITTDAPGCRETVIDGDNGFLVPVKSVDALVAAMERFINEPDLAARMGKRSREIAEEKYDVHKVNAVMIREMRL